MFAGINNNNRQMGEPISQISWNKTWGKLGR